MTLAVCIKCGVQKHGALTPCLRCGYEPETSEDQAKSILLSDHNLTAHELKNISKQMQERKEISFDAEQLKEMSEEINNVDFEKMDAEFRVFDRNCFMIVVAIVVGVIVLSWLIFKW